MHCYACGRIAELKCPRCGRWYCSDHGLDQCAVCMEPAGLLPSTLLFRATLGVLAVSLVLGAWIAIAWPQIVTPPALALAPLPTPTVTPLPPLVPSVASPTPSTPVAGETPSASSTPAGPGSTPTPAVTPTTSSVRKYAVEPGDTLLGIAVRWGVTVGDLTAANGITENTLLQLGQELVIPPSGD